MQDISLLLSRTLKKAGITPVLGEKELLGRWAEVVGEAVASQVKLVDVRDGTLFLKTDSAVWKNEISLQKKAIFQRSNELAGKQVVFRLSFVS